MGKAVVAVLLGAVLVLGCKDAKKPARVADDASLSGRQFRPPTGKVRAVPPHDIHAQGVGPYRLGEPLQDVLGLLPHGPRVELMQIEGLADYRLVRAERDALVIGVGRRGGVLFVSVLDPEIARTESGVGVGTSVEELSAALGPLADPGGRDPHLVEFVALPETRFVVRAGEVTAAVVSAPEEPEQPRPEPPCDRSAVAEHEAELRAASRLGEAARVTGGCFTGGGPEAVVTGHDRLAVVTGEPGKRRRLAHTALPGLSFAAAVDVDGDGRDEIVAIAERRDPERLVSWVEVYRVEGSRLAQVLARPAYELTASAAGWVGANLEDTELLVEVGGGGGALVLGGLYLHREGDQIHSVVPLEPVTIPLRSQRGEAPEPAAPESAEPAAEDAGDAGP